ncbi:MAG: tRNA-dihydrouridine synthase [Propionibacteriaceae bacterium]|nr:tRNA-dihydrouridine synthase [Propionibacteriaceae bacterium]
MAGVTNAAFRQLCAEQWALGRGSRQHSTAGATGAAGAAGAALPEPLFVCEMITAGGIAHRIPRTFELLRFFPGECRSVQLYGTDPALVSRAVAILCGEFEVAHIDLNLGCPVPKVTRRGGGGARPWKLDRTAALLRAAAAAAEPFGVPVSVKTRIGIDEAHTTFRDVGRIAADAGVAFIVLHARTVRQAYSGTADWNRIAELVQASSLPVVGNGDVWEAADARRMRAETGCAGVAIGRGCLGRPWLFRDLAADLSSGLSSGLSADLTDIRATGAAGGSGSSGSSGSSGNNPQRYLPTLGEVCEMVYRHGELLAELHGERWGLTDLRKHMAWYFRGFPVGGELRAQLSLVSSLAGLRGLLDQLDPDAPFPQELAGAPRGRQGSARDHVRLPEGWLDSRTLGDAEISEDGAAGG